MSNQTIRPSRLTQPLEVLDDPRYIGVTCVINEPSDLVEVTVTRRGVQRFTATSQMKAAMHNVGVHPDLYA